MIDTTSASGARAAHHDLAPGWDPDPGGRHQLRYWDGDGWTPWVSDFDIVGQDALMPESVPEPTHDDEHEVERTSSDAVADDSDHHDIASAAPSDALALADVVERLVHHLRELSRQNRRIGTDVELSELAAAALRQARIVQGRPVPDDEG